MQVLKQITFPQVWTEYLHIAEMWKKDQSGYSFYFLGKKCENMQMWRKDQNGGKGIPTFKILNLCHPLFS